MDTVDAEDAALGDGVASPPKFSEEGNKIHMHLRLLGSAPKRLPNWMKYYKISTYTICIIMAMYSLLYLIFIGVHQANPRFQIQYFAIVRYLEYNSYSILSPLLCPILVVVLINHVKSRHKLDEGDFFGVLGIFLFLALLNVHDSWGILKILHWNRDRDIKQSRVNPPPKDDTSRNQFHWQYAWSTKTACSRKFVRELQYKYEYSKEHVVRQVVFVNPSPEGETRAQIVDPNELKCNAYHDVAERAKVRAWMDDLQNEFKCCGPYGYKEWKQWFKKESATKCKKEWINPKTGDIPGCFDPLTRWLDEIMVATVWIMAIQVIFYIIAMFLLGLHHSAMKLEEQKIEKRYSLLSMTNTFVDPEPHWWKSRRPADKAVIVGEFPPKSEDGRVSGSDGSSTTNSVRTANPPYPAGTKGDDAASESSRKGKKKKRRSKDKDNKGNETLVVPRPS